MATKQKNKNRYRTMHSAILTGTLLSFLPLLVLMKSGTGGSAASVDLATAQVGQVQPVSATQVASSSGSQAIAVSASPTQTTTSSSTASSTTTSTASTKQTSSAMTYTQTKAS